MLSLLAVFFTLRYISMFGEEWTNKLLPKTQNLLIVDSFFLASLHRLVRGEWLTAQMWACYINKNHTLSDLSIVDAAILHNSVSTNNETKTTYL